MNGNTLTRLARPAQLADARRSLAPRPRDSSPRGRRLGSRAPVGYEGGPEQPYAPPQGTKTAGLQSPWKPAVGLSGPGVTLIGDELKRARGYVFRSEVVLRDAHLVSRGLKHPAGPKTASPRRFFRIYMPCIKSDAPWAQSWMAAHYGPPLDTSGARHARHQI